MFYYTHVKLIQQSITNLYATMIDLSAKHCGCHRFTKTFNETFRKENKIDIGNSGYSPYN